MFQIHNSAADNMITIVVTEAISQYSTPMRDNFPKKDCSVVHILFCGKNVTRETNRSRIVITQRSPPRTTVDALKKDVQ